MLLHLLVLLYSSLVVDGDVGEGSFGLNRCSPTSVADEADALYLELKEIVCNEKQFYKFDVPKSGWILRRAWNRKFRISETAVVSKLSLAARLFRFPNNLIVQHFEHYQGAASTKRQFKARSEQYARSGYEPVLAAEEHCKMICGASSAGSCWTQHREILV